MGAKAFLTQDLAVVPKVSFCVEDMDQKEAKMKRRR